MNTQVNASATTAGPNVHVHRNLDSRDDLQVGPDESVENVAQGAHLDSDSFSEVDDILVAHRGAEIVDQTAGDVVSDSAALDPGTTGIGHIVTSPFPGDYNHHYRDSAQVVEEVRMTIARYRPYGVKHSDWNAFADFIRELVTSANPSGRVDALNMLGLARKYVAWATSTTGLAPGPKLFHPAVIERYMVHHSDLKVESKRRAEGRLMRMAAAATGGALLPASSNGLPPLAQPYTRAESALQDSWAMSHPQEWRRRDSTLALCLGRGAGIETAEMVALKARDIETVGTYTALRINGSNPRLVPVFDDQATVLMAALARYSISDHLFTHASRETRSMQAAHANRPKLGKPNPKRLRSTWIVRHLNAGSPLPEFLAAAGLTSTSTLNRYLPYVTPTPGAFELLAGSEVAR